MVAEMQQHQSPNLQHSVTTTAATSKKNVPAHTVTTVIAKGKICKDGAMGVGFFYTVGLRRNLLKNMPNFF